MKICGYGVELVRLQPDHLELVRNHRNSERIQSTMIYRKTISQEEQIKWFHSINNIYNNYFVIYYEDRAVGLISGAQLNWEKKETGNGGIFIWDEDVLGTSVPLASSIILTDVSVYLGLQRTFVKILNSNTHAIKYVKALGYKQFNAEQDNESSWYILDNLIFAKISKDLKAKFFSNFPDQLVIYCDDKEEIERFFYDKFSEAARSFPKKLILHKF